MNDKNYKKLSKDKLLKKLTDIQYKVTQENATERPFENEFWNFNKQGIYVDIVTGEPLFSSKDKFQSECGWPAFSRVVDKKFIKNKSDFSLGMHRVEVKSKYGDSHLGHIFEDGPIEQGGLRYCINSAALRFIPVEKLKEEGYEEYLILFKEE